MNRPIRTTLFLLCLIVFIGSFLAWIITRQRTPLVIAVGFIFPQFPGLLIHTLINVKNKWLFVSMSFIAPVIALLVGWIDTNIAAAAIIAKGGKPCGLMLIVPLFLFIFHLLVGLFVHVTLYSEKVKSHNSE